MPDIKGTTEFFAADLPRYELEKPYWAVLGEGQTLGPGIPFDNMEWENHELCITDVRGREADFTLPKSGFQIFQHHAQSLAFQTNEACEEYKKAMDVKLEEIFGAEYSFCYDLGQRHAVPLVEMARDVNDQLQVQGPALGLHNDITLDSGPEILERYLPEDLKNRFLKSGYRFRIVNTWRSLNTICEDRPLLFCDFRTLHPDDLIPADRILPDRVGEIYHVRYQKSQRWCWLEHQTPDELLVMVQYDSHPLDGEARLCPHGSFVNTRASKDAPPRRSVETRSIVISKR